MTTGEPPVPLVANIAAMEGIVTAVEPQQRRGGQRVNVFVDGRYAFSLQRDLANLVRVGEPLSELQTAELLRDDEQARAFEAALIFLSYRPRSEHEVRERLFKKNVPEPVIDSVIERLKGARLVEDEEFARYWIEQRQAHRPRGARLLRQELRQKGLDSDIVGNALASSSEVEDPVDAAYRAGQRKARSLRAVEEHPFREKLGQFLLRRGFDYETARAACRRLWEEKLSEP
jgi:regulatory protein